MVKWYLVECDVRSGCQTPIGDTDSIGKLPWAACSADREYKLYRGTAGRFNGIKIAEFNGRDEYDVRAFLASYPCYDGQRGPREWARYADCAV